MRLLIVTQTVDENDPPLGFFQQWIAEFAERVGSLSVICLKQGEYTLPESVRVHSLGKERTRGPLRKLLYAIRFLRLAWSLRASYDVVFIHMNQEYAVLGGWLFKILGKRVYLWRNHYSGSWLTDLAAFWCDGVFCTSVHSYTARYRKTMFMPVGVDTKLFTPATIARTPNSILFLGRMASSKRADLLLKSLGKLAREGVAFAATFVGPRVPGEDAYYESLIQQAEDLGLQRQVTFVPGVAHRELPDLYRTHEIFVNTSPSGMYDKTLFEAAASGCVVLAASEDWRKRAGEDAWFSADPNDLAERVKRALLLSQEEKMNHGKRFRRIAEEEDLSILIDRLVEVMRAT